MTKAPTAAPEASAAPLSLVATIAAGRAQIEAQLCDIREQINAARDRLTELDDAPVPTGEYIANIERWVDVQAARFAEGAEFSLSPLRAPAALFSRVELLKLPVRGVSRGEDVAAADVAPALCWLFGDQIKAKLAALVQAADLPEGPPADARPALRRELLAGLDQLELSEEALIVEAQAAGLVFARRPDARPEIILSQDGKTLAR